MHHRYTLEDAKIARPTVTRGYPGFPVQQNTLAVCEDGHTRSVDFGVADTFFTCPAKAKIDGKTIYGFLSYEEDASDNFRRYATFIAANDQKKARASYRQSIQI